MNRSAIPNAVHNCWWINIMKILPDAVYTHICQPRLAYTRQYLHLKLSIYQEMIYDTWVEDIGVTFWEALFPNGGKKFLSDPSRWNCRKAMKTRSRGFLKPTRFYPCVWSFSFQENHFANKYWPHLSFALLKKPKHCQEHSSECNLNPSPKI